MTITKPRSRTSLRAKDGSFTVHHTNIETFILKMYKIKHKLSEKCLKDLFSAVSGNYNLRSLSDFRVPGINRVLTGPVQLGILDRWYGIILKMI